MEYRHLWIAINDRWSYFEADWKPASWDTGFRFIFVRQKVEKQIKAPLQLDLFEPRDHQYDFNLIVTNKSETGNFSITPGESNKSADNSMTVCYEWVP